MAVEFKGERLRINKFYCAVLRYVFALFTDFFFSSFSSVFSVFRKSLRKSLIPALEWMISLILMVSLNWKHLFLLIWSGHLCTMWLNLQKERTVLKIQVQWTKPLCTVRSSHIFFWATDYMHNKGKDTREQYASGKTTTHIIYIASDDIGEGRSSTFLGELIIKRRP